jgi:hypothetical protein
VCSPHLSQLKVVITEILAPAVPLHLSRGSSFSLTSASSSFPLPSYTPHTQLLTPTTHRSKENCHKRLTSMRRKQVEQRNYQNTAATQNIPTNVSYSSSCFITLLFSSNQPLTPYGTDDTLFYPKRPGNEVSKSHLLLAGLVM